MKKSFEEMTFDELKLYRREGAWRGVGGILVVAVVIVCMIIMTVNHVSYSNIYKFRTLGMAIVVPFLGYLRTGMKATKVMLKYHPDWIKKSKLGVHIPLPPEWHLKRALVIGVALISVIGGFVTFYHPQHVTTTIPDTSNSLIYPDYTTYYSDLPSISESKSESTASESSSTTEGGQ